MTWKSGKRWIFLATYLASRH
ncbi:MAG: KxYKxGKxW signal peptide domain-containing protein [Planctomycetes bacterium]|nr:KxYKxGKxW signal peptide domain-containing protein [Planctomycetota bacterium]